MRKVSTISIRIKDGHLPSSLNKVLFLPFMLRTTIIEALKYAITGSFPPGSGRTGSALVHDPKVILQTSVRATVKMGFISRTGQKYSVERSMELSLKNAFKQFDGTLRTKDPITGKRDFRTLKCSELETQIPELLGTSKSILDHVIFCHQEDASWLLAEPATLKKRFDDIFSSTIYSKALQEFRQRHKDLVAEVKELEKVLVDYSAKKESADELRADICGRQARIDCVQAHIDNVQKDLSDLQINMKRYQDIVTNVEEID